MKTKLKILTVIAMTCGLLLNLRFAMEGYSNMETAYADESGSGSDVPKFNIVHQDCTLILAGPAGGSYDFHGFKGKFNNSGTAVIIATGASTICVAGTTQVQCQNLSCEQYWASLN